MNRITSKIDVGSAEFAENRDIYLGELSTLRTRQQWVIDGGERRQRSIKRHLDRGKIMVRDRIDLVTDDNTSFLEFSTLSAYGQYDDEAPGAGVVTGIGIVHGVPWVFIANDATVKGGSLLPMSIKKHVRAQEIAEENRLGIIYLVDSGGAFLPLQDEIFPDKDHFGGSFYRQARLSAQGLPQLAVVLGGCTAGGAYVPALSDEVIMVEGIGRIFLGGPPIVKAALGEIIEPDDLGGAVLHTRISGVSDYMASSEREAYGKLREICETTNQRRVDQRDGWLDWVEPEPPAYPPEEIYGIVSADDRIPFDATEIIARIVDGSRFAAFKPEWGESIVCAMPASSGRPSTPSAFHIRLELLLEADRAPTPMNPVRIVPPVQSDAQVLSRHQDTLRVWPGRVRQGPSKADEHHPEPHRECCVDDSTDGPLPPGIHRLAPP